MPPPRSDLGRLIELMTTRRVYDPWQDLARRSGVALRWHSGDVGRFRNPFAVTNFRELSVSFSVGMPDWQMRATCAHECAHLDRGPITPSELAREEERVDLLAAQRLIDPALFEALVQTYPEPSATQIHQVLRTSEDHFAIYEQWRRGAGKQTAFLAWEQDLQPWPAPWIENHASDMPTATLRAMAANEADTDFDSTSSGRMGTFAWLPEINH